MRGRLRSVEWKLRQAQLEELRLKTPHILLQKKGKTPLILLQKMIKTTRSILQKI